jgi:hypothetical protein
MPTWRGFKKVAFQAGLYEAQDVLAAIDDVDLIPMVPGPGLRLREQWQRRLLWHDVSRRLIFCNPGLRPVRLDHDYELFILVCQNWWDLPYVNALQGWRDRCRVTVCYLDEIYAGIVPRCKYWLQALNQFDHVIVGLRDSVGAVSKALGRPCHYVPGAVDALRFSPYPHVPERVIDVYSIGRRWEGVHTCLLNMARHEGLFYVYDTLQGADGLAFDHRQHRDLLASMAKRSHCFMVGAAKMGVLADTHGQLEVGYRYFEGSAAGAVMIGQAPDCASFHELFGWPDSVIPLHPDGSNVPQVMTALSAEPERFDCIGRENAAQALLRHDWAYRWKQILSIAGVPISPALHARERRLQELADLARSAKGSLMRAAAN